MSVLAKVIVLPIKYIWVIGLVFGFAFAAGLVSFPGVSAQQAQECSGEFIENDCFSEEEAELTDVCSNIDGFQYQVPLGFIVADDQENICVDKSLQPQTLGESTSAPQVQAVTGSFGK